MKEQYIKKLIRLVEESKIESLEVTSWGRRIKITQHPAGSQNGHEDRPVTLQQVAPPPAPPPTAPPPAAEQPAAQKEEPATEETGRFVPIKSPMVGTFYAAPAPDADPYVTSNQKLTVGQVVCIVEAMKLMNEIESEISGRVAKILVENAQPVEFGQTLFLIDPD